MQDIFYFLYFKYYNSIKFTKKEKEILVIKIRNILKHIIIHLGIIFSKSI